MRDWKKYVRAVTPYTPGEQPDDPGMIKLNTNENPYGASPAAEAALAGVGAEALRRYPDPAATELVEAIAEQYDVGSDQVFVGVGSDDVLAMAFQTFFNADAPILFPDVTYSFYDVWAEAFGIPYERIALAEDFTLRPEDYRRECGGIVFPNPNAPTGLALPVDAVRDILDHNRNVVVIVDEAYVDFGADSAISLIEEFDNLLVVQTTSKSRSMAGMRIGFAFGDAELIRYLQDFKYSFNSYTMSRPAIAAGAAAMRDAAYFGETVARIIETREWAKEQFRMRGFSCGDSRANFLFVTHAERPARELFDALSARHIYVRYFDRPRIDNYLRVTIGTREEMEALFAALDEIL